MAPHRNPTLPPRIPQPKTAGANSKLDKTWGQGHDELGYLPFPAAGGALLFHLISQFYEKTSLLHNKPVVCRMGHRIGDTKMTTALLDRITHHCVILETGVSVR